MSDWLKLYIVYTLHQKLRLSELNRLETTPGNKKRLLNCTVGNLMLVGSSHTQLS